MTLAKRLFDLGIALPALAVFSPLLVVLFAIVRLDSAGPGLYRARRVGLHGREFSLYKFRSMVIDADQVGSYQTQPGDPRITRVGRVLRASSLDELPQLLNVVKGEMSIVGPRPDLPKQIDDYTEGEWRLRTSIPPGITGLAQSSGRSTLNAEERKRLDLEYATRSSVVLDIRIVFNTARQLLRGGSW